LELTKFLIQQGFTQFKNDYSLFTKVSKGLCTFILVYVDDLLITGDDAQSIAHIKASLHTTSTIKNLGLARYFCGIKMARSSSRIFLTKGSIYWTY